MRNGRYSENTTPSHIWRPHETCSVDGTKECFCTSWESTKEKPDWPQSGYVVSLPTALSYNTFCNTLKLYDHLAKAEVGVKLARKMSDGDLSRSSFATWHVRSLGRRSLTFSIQWVDVSRHESRRDCRSDCVTTRERCIVEYWPPERHHQGERLNLVQTITNVSDDMKGEKLADVFSVMPGHGEGCYILLDIIWDHNLLLDGFYVKSSKEWLTWRDIVFSNDCNRDSSISAKKGINSTEKAARETTAHNSPKKASVRQKWLWFLWYEHPLDLEKNDIPV